MASNPKNVAVLGSTGSVGENTLQVIANSQGELRVAALSAHTQLERLIEQAIEFEPKCVIVGSPQPAVFFPPIVGVRGKDYPSITDPLETDCANTRKH